MKGNSAKETFTNLLNIFKLHPFWVFLAGVTVSYTFVTTPIVLIYNSATTDKEIMSSISYLILNPYLGEKKISLIVEPNGFGVVKFPSDRIASTSDSFTLHPGKNKYSEVDISIDTTKSKVVSIITRSAIKDKVIEKMLNNSLTTFSNDWFPFKITMITILFPVVYLSVFWGGFVQFIDLRDRATKFLSRNS